MDNPLKFICAIWRMFYKGAKKSFILLGEISFHGQWIVVGHMISTKRIAMDI